MQALLRVEQNPGSDRHYELLGYPWLEVIWVEPWALAVPDEEYGAWCDRRIAVQYVCRTDHGLIRISSDDFWAAIEEYEEYVAVHSDDKTEAPLQIVAGAGSVVHVGNSAGSQFAAIGQAKEAGIVQTGEWDLELLSREIATLRKQVASEDGRDSQLRAGVLAEAEIAAERGDADGVAGALRRLGRWVGKSAGDLGLALLEAFIKKQVDL